MTRINLIIFLTIFINLFQLQRINGNIIRKLKSEIDCSRYESDDQILQSFPYFIDRNPTVIRPGTPYTKMDKHFNVISLRIINKKWVPREIYCLKYLRVLNMENMNTGGKFPVDIKYLPLSLIELGIYNTKIIKIPENISQLKQLEALILSNTSLVSIPDSIGYLTKLIVINFEENNLTTLPKSMENLKNLTGIFLSYNPRLYSIESLNGLPSLRTLEARKCSITNLPRNLPLLHELHMSNNKLTTLSGIQTLGFGTNNSKSFHFNGNDIQYIKPEIESVVNLHVLNLEQNKLHGLPTNIHSVTTLVELNIKQNHFYRLNATLSKLYEALPNVKVLHD